MKRLLAAVLAACAGACGGNVPAGFSLVDAALTDGGGGGADAPLTTDGPSGGGTDAPLGADARVIDAPLGGDGAIGGDGAAGDGPIGGGADARLTDARLADARPPDARTADARIPPDAKVPPDAKITPDAATPDAMGNCDPLETTLTGPTPYLIHEEGETTSVASVVTGTGPFTCSFYTGPGRGTRPGDVTLGASSCTLAGGADDDDRPGQYGFIVRVKDVCGNTVDVPVAYRNTDCESDDITLAPAPWPPRLQDNAVAGYGWDWSADIDTVPTTPGFCQICYGFALGTLPPLAATSSLVCANSGTLCSDCDECIDPFQCMQSSTTMSRAITIKPHAALRSDGGPAWATVQFQFIYSGTMLSPMCGPKAWTCHLESMEL